MYNGVWLSTSPLWQNIGHILEMVCLWYLKVVRLPNICPKSINTKHYHLALASSAKKNESRPYLPEGIISGWHVQPLTRHDVSLPDSQPWSSWTQTSQQLPLSSDDGGQDLARILGTQLLGIDPDDEWTRLASLSWDAKILNCSDSVCPDGVTSMTAQKEISPPLAGNPKVSIPKQLAWDQHVAKSRNAK